MARGTTALFGLLSLSAALAVSQPATASAANHVNAHDGDHQAKDDDEKPPERVPTYGGLGFMSFGVMAGPIGDITNGLADEFALGAGAKSPEFAYTIGGGGRMLAFQRLIVGGKGFGLFAPQVGGVNGTAKLGGGGGGLELGFAAVSSRKWLFFPYFGVGGFGLGLDVRNESGSAIVFGDADPIRPGESDTYSSGFVYIEVGAGIHRLLLVQDGGFAVGFDVGGMFSAAPTRWSSDNQDLRGVDRPRLSGAYLRLTLGGGGFLMRPTKR